MGTLIYIGLPQRIEENAHNNLRRSLAKDLSASLKEYYSYPIDMQIYQQSDDPKVIIYVMNGSKYPNTEADISKTIEGCVKRVYDIEAKVRLNYSVINPNFKPSLVPEGSPTLTPPVLPPTPADTIENNSSAGEFSGKNTSGSANNKKSDEFDYEKLSQNFQSVAPHFSFNQVILPQKTIEQIIEAVSIIEVENKVFDEWGLRSIIPTATSAISFYGVPGTGKSMAAEAIAQKLGKKILKATYADIESKYHGEGPKMVKAIFRSAERDDAVLFLDESDSLLSKRLINVTDGSAQAINSMRSQLLISLENFRGIVIFATNLVINYDKAFISRLINIEFPRPDTECRERIWKQHLIGGEGTTRLRIPLCDDININKLAQDYDFTGREIRNSVKKACVTVAMSNRDRVTQSDLIVASDKTKEEVEKVLQSNDHTKSSIGGVQDDIIKKTIQQKLNASITPA